MPKISLMEQAMSAEKKQDESPLVNIMVNVLIPVIVLSKMSKAPEADSQIWHLGPHKALILALSIPLIYGIYYFLKTKKFNIFSGIGLFSVILTGAVTLYLWNEDGTVKPDAALWFGIKEAIQPLILGTVVLATHWTKGPLFREFIYNPSIFDIQRIENKVAEDKAEEPYNKLLFTNTLFFCCSFVISAIINIVIAFYFLGSLDHTADNAQELYNQATAKITFWGLIFILVPMLFILTAILFKHSKDLQKLTKLTREEVLLLGQ